MSTYGYRVLQEGGILIFCSGYNIDQYNNIGQKYNWANISSVLSINQLPLFRNAVSNCATLRSSYIHFLEYSDTAKFLSKQMTKKYLTEVRLAQK